MPFPFDATAPNYSNTGTGAASRFIPELWSSKLVQKFYDATVFSEISNTDYEGEIKSMGDTVHIRTTASIIINDYVKGVPAGLSYQRPESTSIELHIDKGKYFAFELFDVDRHQSDIDLMNDWSTDGSEQMKVSVDTDVLGNIYASAHSDNVGLTAGRKSGDINLGVAGTPLALTKANVLDAIVDFNTVLQEQNAPSDRFIVIPARMAGLIQKSDLRDASMTGDGQSSLRTGRLGKISNFTLYESNNVNKTGSEWDIIFGHKKATTFASQITFMEQLKNPDDFGDLARSLMVYGYEVVDPTLLGHAVVTIA